MRPLRLACLAYLAVALPSSVLGLLWPSMQLSFHEPVGALGFLLIFGTAASVLSSAVTGRILSRLTAGPLLPVGIIAIAAALALESVAPSAWVFVAGTVVFGAGFGAMDAALNAHAASHFGARDVSWMHASFGLGATIGPLLVTALLSDGLGWRRAYGTMAVVLAVLAVVFLLARRAWAASPLPSLRPGPAEVLPPPRREGRRGLPAAVAGLLVFAAVEAGIEGGAGLWGYVFLTSGRGLPPAAAGAAVAAYWAMMFAGRAVLGPVAERAGPARVLAGAVAGVALGAAVMSVPGPALVAVLGMMMLGLAAAPIFPLLTITTTQWSGPATVRQTTRTVSLQVAASTAGGAVLPAAMGLAIGAFRASALAPVLLLLSLAMCGLYGLLSRSSGGTSARTQSGQL